MEARVRHGAFPCPAIDFGFLFLQRAGAGCRPSRPPPPDAQMHTPEGTPRATPRTHTPRTPLTRVDARVVVPDLDLLDVPDVQQVADDKAVQRAAPEGRRGGAHVAADARPLPVHARLVAQLKVAWARGKGVGGWVKDGKGRAGVGVGGEREGKAGRVGGMGAGGRRRARRRRGRGASGRREAMLCAVARGVFVRASPDQPSSAPPPTPQGSTRLGHSTTRPHTSPRPCHAARPPARSPVEPSSPNTLHVTLALVPAPNTSPVWTSTR